MRIGFLLDVLGSPQPKVPVFLEGPGLKAHTAVIAQSGSGKSFMLGRFLEELISKTKGRVIILDPNSDFVKFPQVNEAAWKDQKIRAWFDRRKDKLSEFRDRWGRVRFLVFTNREEKELGLPTSQAVVLPVSLSWEELDLFGRASILELDMASTPHEMYVLHKAHKCMKKSLKSGEQPTLKRFIDYAGAVWAKSAGFTGPLPSWPVNEIDIANDKEVIPDAAFCLYSKAEGLSMQGNIWDKTEPINSVAQQTKEFALGISPNRVIVVDIASLSSVKEKMSVVAATLDSLWRGAREAWTEALSKEGQDDERCPTFIVIDEAQNIAPEDGSEKLGKYVTDNLVRIAAEGRKFGLFLIIVTQRPSRVHPGILSQCDNLCLLKVSNMRDLELVEQQFGFVPKGWTQRALQFSVGDALLSGSFIDKPVFAHIAPRRTVEGGRNLRDAFWLKDPIL